MITQGGEERLALREKLKGLLSKISYFMRRQLPGHLTEEDTTFPGHSYSHAFSEDDCPRIDPEEEKYCIQCYDTELFRQSMVKAINEMEPLHPEHPDSKESLLAFFENDIAADFKTYIAHVIRKTHESKAEKVIIERLDMETVIIRCDW
jgi:hypothetical protein